MALITVCIPAYEMRGLGHIFLKESLDILCDQTFKDFDVVVCDNSKKDDNIKNLCDEYTSKLDLHYFSNPQGTNLASNLNYVIKNNCATGKFIKILAQDDFLYGNDSLEILVKNIDQEKDIWIVAGCIHTKDCKKFFKPFFPKYNRSLHLGNNTLGGLDVLTIKNDSPLLFNEEFIWLVDCDYYKKYYDTYGPPKIINKILAAVRLGDHNITNTEATLNIRTADFKKMLKKHEKGLSYWFYNTVYYVKYPLRKVYLELKNLGTKVRKMKK